MSNVKFLCFNAPNNFYDGECVQDVYLYDASGIRIKFDHKRIELASINDGYISTCSDYDCYIKAIRLTSVRRALKLSYAKKDNFIIKTSSDAYFSKQYDLYIYCGAGGDATITSTNEYKYNHENDGEQNYMMGYGIKFNHNAVLTVCHHEKIECEHYELKPGEKYGDGFGTKDAPVVRDYDTTGSVFASVKGFKPSKGIIRQWKEDTEFAGINIIHSPYITRTTKTDERQQREKFASELSEKYGISNYKAMELLKDYKLIKRG